MSNRLKIIYIVHQFLPHHRHGTELSTYEMAKALQRFNHQVYIFAAEKGNFQREITIEDEIYDGLPIWRVYFNPRTENSLLSHAGLDYVFSQFLDKVKPDIVHIQHIANLSLSLITVARSRGIPVVMHARDYFLICARLFFFRSDGTTCVKSNLASDCLNCLQESIPISTGMKIKSLMLAIKQNWRKRRSYSLVFSKVITSLVYRILPPLQLNTENQIVFRNKIICEQLSKVNYVLIACTDIKKHYREYLNLPEAQLKVLPMTVDTSTCLFKIRHIDKLPLRFGFVGKFTRWKGVHVLINAFQQISPHKAEVHIYGEPSWTDISDICYYLQNRETANIPNIHFHTPGFSRSELSRVYESFDVLIVPSMGIEPFGRVVVEAFASGVPVICSNIGGPAEQVTHGLDGYHFEVGIVKSLIMIINKLISNPAKIKELSNNIKPPRSIGDYAKQHEETYYDAISDMKEK